VSPSILLEAYSPLGSTGSPLFEEEIVTKIAKKNSVDAGTVLLSYLVGRGIVVLPKSVTPSRIEDNMKIIDLSDDEMKTLNELAASGKQHRFVKPDWGVDLGFKDWDT
jgi:glycerol 2-dehydrogenase (NADP+)